MTTTGYSRIHVARYNYDGTAVTYSGCREIARARSMETDIETSEDNNFYANNRLAEQEPASFVSGTATITVDGLDGEEEAFILGVEAQKAEGRDGVSIEFGADMNPPYLGIGSVVRKQMQNKVTYWAVIFWKARFAIPSDSAETQEESISWQEQELNATLLRDDTPKQKWKHIETGYATEEDAVAYIREVLNYAAQGGINV